MNQRMDILAFGLSVLFPSAVVGGLALGAG